MSDVEYVLTLVLRVEKAERPGRTAALETGARAVLAILADERSVGEGEWAEAMRAWQDARIRKVVRRARGAEWRRAAALPGITVTSADLVSELSRPGAAGRTDDGELLGPTSGELPEGGPAGMEVAGGGLSGDSLAGRQVAGDAPGGDALAGGGLAGGALAGGGLAGGGAAGDAPAGDQTVGGGAVGDGGGGTPVVEVRVFPPVGLGEVPKELAKLQVTGTDLEDPEEPGEPGSGVPVLWVNPRLEMSTGKTMAQCGHAAHLAWLALPESARKAWIADDFRLAVRTATPTQWTELLRADLPVVQDAGFTEVAPGSCTVIADHPHFRR